MFSGRRITIDDELKPKLKFFYRIAAKKHKQYFKGNSDLNDHYRKLLLGYLEYAGFIGQSISAKKAAMTAALEAQNSDSDDVGFFETTQIYVGSGLNLDAVEEEDGGEGNGLYESLHHLLVLISDVNVHRPV